MAVVIHSIGMSCRNLCRDGICSNASTWRIGVRYILRYGHVSMIVNTMRSTWRWWEGAWGWRDPGDTFLYDRDFGPWWNIFRRRSCVYPVEKNKKVSHSCSSFAYGGITRRLPRPWRAQPTIHNHQTTPTLYPQLDQHFTSRHHLVTSHYTLLSQEVSVITRQA